MISTAAIVIMIYHNKGLQLNYYYFIDDDDWYINNINCIIYYYYCFNYTGTLLLMV